MSVDKNKEVCEGEQTKHQARYSVMDVTLTA